MSNRFYNTSFTATPFSLLKSSTLNAQFALIGTGMMGCEHIRNVNALPGATITAVSGLAGVDRVYDGTTAAGLNLGANYTWLDATFRSDEVLNGASNSSNDQAQAGFPGVDGTIEVKSGDCRAMRTLSMLPSCSAMTCATCASSTGSSNQA